MWLKQIFDSFSRRLPGEEIRHEVPATTRNRVLLWCGDVFSNRRGLSSQSSYIGGFWEEIHRRLQFRHGRPQLSNRESPSRPEDVVVFLASCRGAEFLDFLEDVFRVECYVHVSLPEVQVVAELNELLRADDLPYHVTDFVKETVREVRDGPPPFGGREGTYINTLAYPTVIMRDSEVVHAEVVEPALKLLRAPAFKNANAEYLAALNDYRKGELGDCLTKCGSAFESVMKVICEGKGWPYRRTDSALPLVRTMLERTNLGSYLENGLMVGPVIRNKASTSHGAGVETRQVPRHLARYALHSTAAAILLLMAETSQE